MIHTERRRRERESVNRDSNGVTEHNSGETPLVTNDGENIYYTLGLSGCCCCMRNLALEPLVFGLMLLLLLVVSHRGNCVCVMLLLFDNAAASAALLCII